MRETGRQTDRQTDRPKVRETCRQTDRQTDRPSDRQMEGAEGTDRERKQEAGEAERDEEVNRQTQRE